MAEAVERLARLETTVERHDRTLEAHDRQLKAHDEYIAGIKATSRFWSTVGAFVGSIIGGGILLLLERVFTK